MESPVRKFPIFAYPQTLKFYLGARHTHKQLLTLYNPYEFGVRFKIMSTAPNKYTVIDPEGTIGPLCCVDLVVRHTQPMTSNCNFVDKFRIFMHEHTTRKALGKKDIEAKLFQGEPDNISNDGDSFQVVPQGERSPEDERRQYPIPNSRSPNTSSQNYLAVILGIVCSLGMFWPMQPEPPVESHFIPSYLHITLTVKIVFAYILGLITIVIFKP